MKKIIIWIIGSNSTGKTTQAALLHKSLGSKNPKIVKKDGAVITLFDNSINIGSFKHPITGGFEKVTQCCGTDTVNKKELIKQSVDLAFEHEQPILILEGVMATGTWPEFLQRSDSKLAVLHMKTTLKSNLRKLRKRRAEKKGLKPREVVFSDKTIKNIEGKVKGFENMYWKVLPLCDYGMQIDSNQPKNKIHDSIIYWMNNVIL